MFQLNTTLTSLTDAVTSIEQQLDMTQMMLDAVNAFNGSVNQTTVQNVWNRAMSYNSTIVALADGANAFLAQLLQDQSLVNDAWMVAENLNVTVESLLTAISQSEGNLSIAVSLVDDFREDFNSLMSNLTLLDVRASMLLLEVGVLSRASNNASQDVATANSSLQVLILNVEQRRALANTALGLAQNLNSSVEAARVAAEETLNSANALMVSHIISIQTVHYIHPKPVKFHTHTHICTLTHIHIYICVHTHATTHIHTHTLTHTPTPTPTHQPTHPPTHSPIHPPTHTPTAMHTQSLTEQVVMDARTTLDNIALNLSNTDALMQQLNTAKSMAQDVLNIPVPSLDYAVTLASQINDSIVPDDVVQEILNNATSSRMAAEQAVATALNARYVSTH